VLNKKQAEILGLWQEYLSNLSEDAQTIYSRAIAEFFRVTGRRPIDVADIKPEEIFGFVAHLKRKKLSPNSIRLYTIALKRFLELSGHPLDVQNLARLRMLLPKKKIIRETNSIPREVVKKLIMAASPKKSLLYHLLWATGLRIGEALNLRKKDIDLSSDPARVFVLSEKTGRLRMVFLPSDVAERLKPFLEKLADDDFIFHVTGDRKKPLNRDKIGASFRMTLLKLGLLKRDASGRGYNYTIHSFRRSYETTLAQSGVHPMVVKYFMGHTQGVEDSYLRLSEGSLISEWKKAEPTLRLDLEETEEKYTEMKMEIDRLRKEVEMLSSILVVLLGEDLTEAQNKDLREIGRELFQLANDINLKNPRKCLRDVKEIARKAGVLKFLLERKG